MANLLPPHAQKRVGSIYRARFGTVLSLLALALAACTILALVPSMLALALSPLPEIASDAERPPSDDVKSLVRTQSLVTHALPVVLATTSPSELIRSTLRAKPSNVTVQRITYAGGAKVQLVVTGIATREGVRAYRDSLNALDIFSAVSVPVGSLVGSEATSFSLTLTHTQ